MITTSITPSSTAPDNGLTVQVLGDRALINIVDANGPTLASAVVDSDHMLHAVQGPEGFSRILNPADPGASPNYVGIEVSDDEIFVAIVIRGAVDQMKVVSAQVTTKDLAHALTGPPAPMGDNWSTSVQADRRLGEERPAASMFLQVDQPQLKVFDSKAA